jgi:hypothetical protein
MDVLRVLVWIAVGIFVLYCTVRDIASERKLVESWKIAHAVRKLEEKARAPTQASEPTIEALDYRTARREVTPIVRATWLERVRARWRAKQQLEMERRLSR